MTGYDTEITLYIVRDSYGNVVYASTDPQQAERMRQWNEWVIEQLVDISGPKHPEVESGQN